MGRTWPKDLGLTRHSCEEAVVLRRIVKHNLPLRLLVISRRGFSCVLRGARSWNVDPSPAVSAVLRRRIVAALG